MTETALQDLYRIMRTGRQMRDRLNAAISASRVEPVIGPDDEKPSGVAFLRWVLDVEKDGAKFSEAWQREAAAALVFFEKRCTAAANRFGPGIEWSPEDQRRSWYMGHRNAMWAENHGTLPADWQDRVPPRPDDYQPGDLIKVDGQWWDNLHQCFRSG